MTYYLFDSSNVCIGKENDVKSALQVFGEIYDSAGDDRDDYRVEVYFNLPNGKEKYYSVDYLPTFLNKFVPEADEGKTYQRITYYDDCGHVTIKDQHGNDVKIMTNSQREAYNAGDKKAFQETAANFTEDEYVTVLKYIPTGFILGELARRLEEYESVTNEIQHTLSNMKIYTSDKKGH